MRAGSWAQGMGLGHGLQGQCGNECRWAERGGEAYGCLAGQEDRRTGVYAVLASDETETSSIHRTHFSMVESGFQLGVGVGGADPP